MNDIHAFYFIDNVIFQIRLGVAWNLRDFRVLLNILLRIAHTF